MTGYPTLEMCETSYFAIKMLEWHNGSGLHLKLLQ